MKKLEFLLIFILLIAVLLMAPLPRWQINFEAKWNNTGENSSDQKTSAADGEPGENIGIGRGPNQGETLAQQNPGSVNPDIYPDRPVTRIEFLVLTYKKTGLQQEADEVPFLDVRPHSNISRYIYPMFKRGWIAGYPDQTLRPHEIITRNEAEIIVARILGEPVPAGKDKSAYLTQREMFQLLSYLNRE